MQVFLKFLPQIFQLLLKFIEKKQQGEIIFETKFDESFRLQEYTHSETAIRFNINNIPSDEAIGNLKFLHKIRLQLENQIGGKLIITSAFRCLELNKKIGSSDNSQHIKGEAMDFICLGYTPKDLFEFIKNKAEFEYDQLILEFNQWIHLSVKKDGNRKQVLEINK